MKIEYLRHAAIDKNRWDAAIDKAINGNLYSYSWYLDTVCGTWDALVNEDYTLLFPLPVREKLGIHYIYTPLFVQQLGLFYTRTAEADAADQFLNAIPANIVYGEINLNHFNLISGLCGDWTPQVNLELEMTRSHAEITAGYSANHRRNVRKASVAGVAYDFTETVVPMVQTFSSHRGATLRGLDTSFYETLDKVVHELKIRSRLSIVKAVLEGEYLGGAVFGHSHQKAVLLFSAVSRTGKLHSAMHGLIDFFISENAARNLTLDFEGSMQPSLARFYSGFGAVEKNYAQYSLQRMGSIPAALVKMVQNLKKRLY